MARSRIILLLVFLLLAWGCKESVAPQGSATSDLPPPENPKPIEPHGDELDIAYAKASKENGSGREEALIKVARQYARKHRMAGLLQVLRELEPAARLPNAMSIAQEIYGDCKPSEILAISDVLDTDSGRTYLLEDVIERYVTDGRIMPAMVLAERIPRTTKQLLIWLDIGEKLVKRGKKDEAATLLGYIEKEVRKNTELLANNEEMGVELAVAELAGTLGQKERALVAADRAVELSRDRNNRSRSNHRIGIQARAAVVMARVGEVKKAIAFLKTIEPQTGDALEKTDRGWAKEQIVMLLLDQGRIDEGIRLAGEKDGFASIRRPTRPSLVVELPAQLTRRGYPDKALALVRKMDPADRQNALFFIASAFVGMDKIEDAIRISDTISELPAKLAVLEQIMQKAFQLSRNDDVERILDGAVRIASRINNRETRGWELAVLARTCIQVRQQERAVPLLEQSYRLMKHSTMRRDMVRGLALVAATAGECRKGIGWLKKERDFLFDLYPKWVAEIVEACLETGQQDAVEQFVRASNGSGRVKMLEHINSWFRRKNASPVESLVQVMSQPQENRVPPSPSEGRKAQPEESASRMLSWGRYFP